MGFVDDILNLENPSFEAIRQLAIRDLNKLDQVVRDEVYEQLKRGTALLETHEQLCTYLNSFGPMHRAKLQDSISRFLFTRTKYLFRNKRI